MTVKEIHVEDIAKAMCAEHDWDAFAQEWESNREYWLALARAALRAIDALDVDA